jgi:hypothetical protein
MPNRKEHRDTAGIIGGVVACISNLAVQTERQLLNINLGELQVNVAAGYAVGAVAGILPDALEPAHHPGHRAVCHSVAAGTALAIGIKKLNANIKISSQLKTLENIAGAAYLSHLLLDSQTPVGLPLC